MPHGGSSCVLLGGVAAGMFPSFQVAWQGIKRREFVVEPDPDAVARYERLRTTEFAPAAEALAATNRGIAEFLHR